MSVVYLFGEGLSPRVRGNRAVGGDPPHGHGSIPARAGEPPTAARAPGMLSVYPRACGGTCTTIAASVLFSGLSPRVRGNHVFHYLRPDGFRSIPARAGEPRPASAPATTRSVYPRACGGTCPPTGALPLSPGLSPRVRGNRRTPPTPALPRRSIPARAGEPRRRRVGGKVSRVYPRACGGTDATCIKCPTAAGLSPRVRGNLGSQQRKVFGHGSIPARAGEPRPARRHRCPPPVYPRACGGTATASTWATAVRGLSPRVRGNQDRLDFADVRLGSIPARAGEPIQESPRT